MKKRARKKAEEYICQDCRKILEEQAASEEEASKAGFHVAG